MCPLFGIICEASAFPFDLMSMMIDECVPYKFMQGLDDENAANVAH